MVVKHITISHMIEGDGIGDEVFLEVTADTAAQAATELITILTNMDQEIPSVLTKLVDVNTWIPPWVDSDILPEEEHMEETKCITCGRVIQPREARPDEEEAVCVPCRIIWDILKVCIVNVLDQETQKERDDSQPKSEYYKLDEESRRCKEQEWFRDMQHREKINRYFRGVK